MLASSLRRWAVAVAVRLRRLLLAVQQEPAACDERRVNLMSCEKEGVTGML